MVKWGDYSKSPTYHLSLLYDVDDGDEPHRHMIHIIPILSTLHPVISTLSPFLSSIFNSYETPGMAGHVIGGVSLLATPDGDAQQYFDASRLLGVGTPKITILDCAEAGMVMGEMPSRMLTDPRNEGRLEQEN